jgi:hypothetical protein
MEKNITVTVKTKLGSLVTIRGDEPQEFVDRVMAASGAGFALAVSAFEELINEPKPDAVQVVVDTLGAEVIQPPAFAPVTPPAPVHQAVAQSTSRQCAHGVMTKRTGEGQWGPYKAYMCPTPKGTPDQCKAIYLKTSDPEWNTF